MNQTAELEGLSAPWPTMTTVFTIVITSADVIGIIANLMVMSIFIYSPDVRATTSNKFIMSLAFSDLLFVANNFINSIFNLMAGHYVGGILGCQLDGYFTVLGGGTSLNTLLLIAIERYLTIVRNVYSSSKIINSIIITQWIVLGFLVGIVPLTGEHFRNNDGFLSLCTIDYASPFSTASGIVTFIILFFLFGCPFGTGMCYRLIIKSFSKAQSDLHQVMVNTLNTSSCIQENDSNRNLEGQMLPYSGSNMMINKPWNSSYNVGEGLTVTGHAMMKSSKRDNTAERGKKDQRMHMTLYIYIFISLIDYIT